MITKRKAPTTVLSLALLVAIGCGEGGEPPITESALVQGGGDAVTIWTEGVELFFEYPPLVAGIPGESWAIHLTTLADFQPVSEGTLTLRFEGPDGTVQTEIEEAPARPGIYTHAPSFSSPGMYDLVMEFRGQGIAEDIFVGPVQVFGSEADLPLLPEEPSVGISFLKEQQWPIEFATVRAATRVVTPGVRATGEVVGASDGVAEIAAPVEGMIRWEENRNAPPEGARVSRGDALVRLSPVGGDNNYAMLVSRSELLKQEVARAGRLVAAEAVPARRLDEARLELEVVQAQLEALNAPADGGYTLTLRSPISGAVSGRHFTVGQRVEAGEPLFTLFDPRRIWIRFHVPAVHASKVRDVTAATYSLEGSTEVFRAERVVTVATALDPKRRTLPVTLAADNSGGELKPGMLVYGRVLFSDAEPALAVPAEAVMDENGILVAYVQIGGETIERRAVSVGDTDGQWTTILSGVRLGEYVVTRGAYQIRLSSLNTSEISDHGHVH
jgi:cobalt-zinc-cadmium efflux system membrane fusion protein